MQHTVNLAITKSLLRVVRKVDRCITGALAGKCRRRYLSTPLLKRGVPPRTPNGVAVAQGICIDALLLRMQLMCILPPQKKKMKVFVFLLFPCFVFLQKLILPGFLRLFEGYHENLHRISDRLVPLTPLGMVWSPSYGSSKGRVESRD